MTFGELKTLVWSWLDDPNAGYFTDAQVSVWLNNALLQVQKKLIQSGELWYALTYSFGTTANVNAYSLPADFLRLHKLELIQSGTFPNENRVRLTPVTPVQVDFLGQGTGLPQGYWLKKNTLMMAKTPDQSYLCELLYSARAETMVSDSDTPDCPTQYHEMIAIYATLDGFLKDQRNPNPVFSQKLADYEQMMKQDAQNRNVDEPRYVVVTESNSSYYGW